MFGLKKENTHTQRLQFLLSWWVEKRLSYILWAPPALCTSGYLNLTSSLLSGSEQIGPHCCEKTFTTCSGDTNRGVIFIDKEPNYKSTISCLFSFWSSQERCWVFKRYGRQRLGLSLFISVDPSLWPFFIPKRGLRSLTKINTSTENKIKQNGL